jgi:hypothetical protein
MIHELEKLSVKQHATEQPLDLRLSENKMIWQLVQKSMEVNIPFIIV